MLAAAPYWGGPAQTQMQRGGQFQNGAPSCLWRPKHKDLLYEVV